MNIVPAGTEPTKSSILESETGKGKKRTQTGKSKMKISWGWKRGMNLFALWILLSHLFHLELSSRGNGRESKAVLVSSQRFPKDISSHTYTKTHVHFQIPVLHALRAQECLAGSCCQLFQQSQLISLCLPSSAWIELREHRFTETATQANRFPSPSHLLSAAIQVVS